MSKKGSFQARGRIFTTVDDVAVEQAGLEHKGKGERECAVQAAKDKPAIASFMRILHNEGIACVLRSANPGPHGKWKVIFSFGDE